MSAKVTFEVSSNLYLVKKLSEEAMIRAATSVGLMTSGNAQSLCPVDTGLLRNSITYALGGESTAISGYTADNPDSEGVVRSGKYEGTAPADEEGKVTVYVGTNVEYAPYLELGHKQQPGRFVPAIKKKLKASWVAARPFLRPAFENHRQEIEKIILDELENA